MKKCDAIDCFKLIIFTLTFKFLKSAQISIHELRLRGPNEIRLVTGQVNKHTPKKHRLHKRIVS